jgi:hypothetical protein
MLRTILAVTLPALLAGCSNTKTLTVHTTPQGAVLTWDGQQYLAPTSLSFDLTKLEQYRNASGCFEVVPFTARWASGAVAGTHDPVLLCGDHASWTLTIEGPTDPPRTRTRSGGGRIALPADRRSPGETPGCHAQHCGDGVCLACRKATLRDRRGELRPIAPNPSPQIEQIPLARAYRGHYEVQSGKNLAGIEDLGRVEGALDALLLLVQVVPVEHHRHQVVLLDAELAGPASGALYNLAYRSILDNMGS